MTMYCSMAVMALQIRFGGGVSGRLSRPGQNGDCNRPQESDHRHHDEQLE